MLDVTNDFQLPVTGKSMSLSLAKARDAVVIPIRQMLQDTGLTEQQWRILRVLSADTKVEATVLAQRAALLLPSQTRIVQVLKEKQLVQRAPHPYDRRKHTLELTSLGRDVLDEYVACVKEINDALIDHLGQADFDLLLGLLDKLMQFGQDAPVPEPSCAR